MPTISQYLSTIAALSYIDEVGTPVELVNEAKSDINYKAYDVNILERNNDEGVAVKHRFVVYDQGGVGENVLTKYVPSFKENLVGYTSLINHISTITNLRSYWIRQLSTEQQFAIVRTMIFVTDHIEVQWYLIYVNGGLQHTLISNPEDF